MRFPLDFLSAAAAGAHYELCGAAVREQNNTDAGGAAFLLTVNGSGFAANSVVYWNGATRTTNHPAANQLTAQINAADIAAAGSATVVVKTPTSTIYNSNGFVSSNSMMFTINTP